MNEPRPTSGLRADALNALRGLLMGSADVIPGVSGGTVALIVGIYTRLVTAISHVDTELVALVRRGQWRAAAQHIDLRFLAALGSGIALGILALGSVMNHLLTSPDTRAATLAAFFGMILASSVLVGRMIDVRTKNQIVGCFVLGVIGAAFAYWITSLPTSTVEPTYPYIFCCGLVAICAMILPGISGAYVLLIMGVYLHLTDILRALPKGQITGDSVVTVLVFGTGCAIGLTTFSRVLKWLLVRHEPQTMAVLCGFMLGSLVKIWPFQADLTPTIEKLSHKLYRNVWPEALDGAVILALSVGVAAMLLVFALDWVVQGHERKPLVDDEPLPAGQASGGRS